MVLSAITSPKIVHKRANVNNFHQYKIGFSHPKLPQFTSNPSRKLQQKEKVLFLLIFNAWNCCYEILMINSELYMLLLLDSMSWNMFMSFQSMCLVKVNSMSIKVTNCQKFSVVSRSFVKVWLEFRWKCLLKVVL